MLRSKTSSSILNYLRHDNVSLAKAHCKLECKTSTGLKLDAGLADITAEYCRAKRCCEFLVSFGPEHFTDKGEVLALRRRVDM